MQQIGRTKPGWQPRKARTRAVALAASLVCVSTSPWAAAAQDLPAEIPAPATKPLLVQEGRERIRADVQALATRAPGAHATAATGDGAAKYIAAQFAAYGLEPEGDDGSYFEKVPLIQIRTLADTRLTVVSDGLDSLALHNGVEVLTGNETGLESTNIDAPIVFAGYGVEAPESGADDYKEVDLTGKVVLLLASDPPLQATDSRHEHSPVHHEDTRALFEQVARHGAVAALLVQPSLSAEDWSGLQKTWGAARYYLHDDVRPRLPAAAWIRPDAARKLLALAGLELETLIAGAQTKDFAPLALPLRLQGHIASEARRIDARNVLGALPGRGGNAQEALLYAARYDDPSRVRDTASMLELARLWSKSTLPPKRTIFFAALTSQDAAAAGAEYLVTHVPIPPGKISVALSCNVRNSGGDSHRVSAEAATRTSFSATAESSARELGLVLADDSPALSSLREEPSAYRFAQGGIPSIALVGSDPETLATFGHELGVRAAAQTKLIEWLPGDEFAAARLQSEITARPGHQPTPHRPKRRK